MKLGSGRFKFLSKLPEAPPSPPSSPNISSSKDTSKDSSNNRDSISSKSSPHLVYSDNHPNTISRELSNLSESNNKITASQSKSSSALLKKQKWESDSPDDIYQLLAEQKLTEQMIWSGHPDLFPIIHQYSDLLNNQPNSNNNNSNNNNGGVGGNVLSINFPIESTEFGDIKKKSYKIGKKLTVAQTVNLVCKKQEIREPRRFWLSTLFGCILNDDMLLSSYGFGTFFDSWELSLVLKQSFTSKVQTDLPLENCGEYVVDFQLPPLKQFGGLKKKRIKVDSNQSVSQILSQICNKYKIEEPERFSIITNEEFPLILNENATLAHYGLGNKIQTLELCIVFTELIPPYSLKNNSVPTYGAFQVGNVDPVQSKAVIIDMENKLQDHLKLGEEMVLNIKELANSLKEKEKEIKDKEAQHFTVMNHIEEKLTKIKQNVTVERENHTKQINDMKLEKDSLNETIKSLKQQLEQLNAKLYQERSANTEATLASNFKISSLEQQVESLNDKNNELSTTLKETEDRYDTLQTQKNEDYQRYCDLLFQKEKEKFETIQRYESMIKNLQKENDEKIKSIIEQQQQQEKEQLEISNKIFNDINNLPLPPPPISPDTSSTTETSSSFYNNSHDENNNSNNNSSGFSFIEREQLLNSIQKLTQDIVDRDLIIKQVYPRKIQNLESNLLKAEDRLKESDQINQQSKQTIALKSLEITELNRQIETLISNNNEIQSVLNLTDTQFKDEQMKNKILLSDLSNLKNQYESQSLVVEQKTQTIQQMESDRVELELKFKERENHLLYEIEELKKPKPPPLPTYKVVSPKSPEVNTDKSISDVKNSLKPIPNLPPPPREHTIATVADLLFVSMQRRFQSIQGPDIENLDDDIEDCQNDEFYD